jgi:adenylyltransferase/sulfurtransferase
LRFAQNEASDGGEALVLIDVRQPWEHELVALPQSQLIPLDELAERADEIAPGRAIVAYCHHGVRSLAAAHILERAGHAGVASLAGGIERWAREIDPSLPRY